MRKLAFIVVAMSGIGSFIVFMYRIKCRIRRMSYGERI